MLATIGQEDLVKNSINNRILKDLCKDRVPWQRSWKGHGKNMGFPRNVFTKKKYFGVNAVLLIQAAEKFGFNSQWWGTAAQFESLGAKVAPRPNYVPEGEWATEILIYKKDVCTNKNTLTSTVVYNSEQLIRPIEETKVTQPLIMPNYNFAEKVMFATGARVVHNDNGEAWYYYPPKDYITLPHKEVFADSLGGLPAYYECLAHELIHWTEPRLKFYENEAIKELRAEIGSTLLGEELNLPHSCAYSNIAKYREAWISKIKHNSGLFINICASVSRAVDYILKFSDLQEERFNSI